MSDFTIRGDSVNVEEIMRRIRARVREKRGVDYTEQEIRELASAKLEKFLDPENVRSELLQEFRRAQQARPPLPNYAFEDTTLFESHRAPIRWLRRLMLPILKLFFFNPNPLIQALHIQSEVNDRLARETRERADLTYEVIHNLVVEMTRLAIEVKNLKMRVESISSRLDFDERRARALEGVVQYRPGAPSATAEAETDDQGEAKGEDAEAGPAGGRGRRRRRRRNRKIGTNRADGQGAGARGQAPDVEADHGEAAGAPRGRGEGPAEGEDGPPAGDRGAAAAAEGRERDLDASEARRPPAPEAPRPAAPPGEPAAAPAAASPGPGPSTSLGVVSSNVEGRTEPDR
jgi:hypothetical protein